MSERQHSFFGTLAKLRKAIITFIMSVCPFVRPHGITRLSEDRFPWNFIFEELSKTCSENFKCYL